MLYVTLLNEYTFPAMVTIRESYNFAVRYEMLYALSISHIYVCLFDCDILKIVTNWINVVTAVRFKLLFRLEYLYLTLRNCESQDRGYEHFDSQ